MKRVITERRWVKTVKAEVLIEAEIGVDDMIDYMASAAYRNRTKRTRMGFGKAKVLSWKPLGPATETEMLDKLIADHCPGGGNG